MTARRARRAARAAAAVAAGCAVAVAPLAGCTGVADGDQGRPPPAVEDPFFVDPGSPAYAAWQEATGQDKLLLARIALTPAAYWVTRPEPADAAAEAAAYLDAASAAGATGLLVLYGIPDRDCGGWSDGGTTVDAYPDWVRAVADVIVPGTWVVLEPDALAMIGECSDGDVRTALLRQAAHDLAGAGAQVYVDAGNAHWLSARVAAERLRAVGVGTGDAQVGDLGGSVRGFALNVSNFDPTNTVLDYGRQVAALLDDAHLVVDTSRNGQGSDGTWCNPPGRGLGASPQLLDDPVVDALVWVKRAGESDGSCNGGPPAGQWWQEQALAMAAEADLDSAWAFRPPPDDVASGAVPPP